MKFVLSLLFAVLIVQVAVAQNTLVSGEIHDPAGKGIAVASIMVLNPKDSSLVKAGLSDDNGHFEMLLSSAGDYLMRYSSIGYETLMQSSVMVSGGIERNLGVITLKPTEAELKSFTVSAKKPMIEVKADKVVFNIENSINATGSDAMQLLRKSPGVMVDNNDNISLKGKNGVRIYVDGRLTQLDSKSLAAYLRSINSNDIEAIEMISNPGAKYDASGNAGIINIRLRKNKKFGTNGSVTAGLVQAIRIKENGSVNLNYRDKKINIFGNLSGSNGINQDGMNLFRLQKDTAYDQHVINTNDNQSVNIKAGADFYLTRKSTLGVLATGNLDNTNWRAASNVAISYQPTDSFVKTLRAGNHVPGQRVNNNYNLNYRYLDTNGTELNIDADYGSFRGRGHSTQPNEYYDVYNQLISNVTYKNSTPTNIDIYTLKADAERKLGKGKLGYGVKSAYVSTSNKFDFYLVNNGLDIRQLDRSNSFFYTENVNAAYINYNRQLNAAWSLQAGLRAENTNSKGVLTRADGLVQADNSVSKSYTDLFPSAALTWNLNKTHAFNLTFSRRIDRPTYQDLNPFENKMDELSYEKGNAFLRPQYTNSVELTHTLLGLVNTTIGYSRVSDFATQVTDTIGNASYIQQRNIATQQIASFGVNAPLPIRKWWNGFVSVWYSYQTFDGKIGATPLALSIPLYGGYMQHTFTLGKGYTAEVSGWYNGPGVWGGTWRTRPEGSLDMGLQKMLLKDNANLKVSITDIFYTAPWRSVNNFGGMHVSGNGNWESRSARITFTYKFGSSTVSKARERKTGLDTEAGRIKGGKG